MLYRAKELSKYKLKGKDGKIGSAKEFYFDDNYWAIRYLVADTGNWLMGRQVLISPYSLVAISEKDESIIVNLTEKEIEECPPLDSDKPVSRQFEESYFDYFKLPAYWNGRYMWGAWPYLMREEQVPVEDNEEKESWDPHLRSTKSVAGYHIQAKDGMIGHVEDFIVDDETWAIRYLVIDTKKLWGGKEVLISPRWIDRISLDEAKVFVNIPQELIKDAPEYTDDLILSRAYEEKLHQHYSQKGYWMDESVDK